LKELLVLDSFDDLDWMKSMR